MWFGSNIRAIGSEGDRLLNRMLPSASCVTRLCLSFFYAPSFSPLHQNSHTHAHSLFLPSLWLQYVSRWPRQVTDGDLTALLTVNWVLIKPKHVWEMLIIHYSLREAAVQPGEHCACACAWVSLVYNHFAHCDKTIRVLLSIYGIAAEKYEAGWTGCLEPPWILQPSGLTVVLTKINTDENSNLILKQTLWKLSWGISNCLSTYLPECGLLKLSTHYCAVSENVKWIKRLRLSEEWQPDKFTRQHI